MHLEKPRNGEPPAVDAIHKPKRAEDFSRIARIASIAMRWQWVIWIVVTLLLAIGFDFKTPSQKFAEVANEAVENRNAMNERINGVERRMNDQDTRMARALTILEGLAIDACDRLGGNRYARTQLGCDDTRRK
jgi:hypothetical protein